MPWWQVVLDLLGLLVLLPVLFGIALILRRHLLTRGGGTFEMSHRVRTTVPGRGWVLGLGRYRGEELEWFRIFAISPRPHRAWRREGLRYTGRRELVGAETFSLYDDHVVVVCTTPTGPCELAMSTASLMGLQAWLESAPPGADWDRPQRP